MQYSLERYPNRVSVRTRQLNHVAYGARTLGKNRSKIFANDSFPRTQRSLFVCVNVCGRVCVCVCLCVCLTELVNSKRRRSSSDEEGSITNLVPQAVPRLVWCLIFYVPQGQQQEQSSQPRRHQQPAISHGLCVGTQEILHHHHSSFRFILVAPSSIVPFEPSSF